VGDRNKNVIFWNCDFYVFYYVIRNLKARRANKAYYYSRVIQFIVCLLNKEMYLV
jgi:hypothetical protein